MKSQTRSNNRRNRKNFSVKRRRGGGLTDILLGASRIRGQKYEHWLEQRLVLFYKDIDFVLKVRELFGFDKTALRTFDYNSVKADFESRKPEDKKIIMQKKMQKKM
jgi:hypothetical protein